MLNGLKKWVRYLLGFWPYLVSFVPTNLRRHKFIIFPFFLLILKILKKEKKKKKENFTNKIKKK